MKIKNIRRDDQASSEESTLACEILAGYTDHHDETPEGTRIIVIVTTGKGRIGCAFEGYDDSDDHLSFDLAMLARAVDLGVKP